MVGMRKLIRAAGFVGSVKYAEENPNGTKPGRYLGGTIPQGVYTSVAGELKAAAKLRPNIRKPCWHQSLRLPEGEQLSDDKWRDLVQDYMTKLGFSPATPYVVYQHDEAAGQHVHIVASRISETGQLYTGQNENLKSSRICRQLEKKYGLTQLPSKSTKTAAYPKKAELEMALRTGKKSEKMELVEAIDSALADKPIAPEFVQRLNDMGVEVRLNIAKSTGRISGISFAFLNSVVAVKGSSLGKGYSWVGLQKRGLDYVKDRDRAALAESAIHRTTKSNPKSGGGSQDGDRYDKKSTESNQQSATEHREPGQAPAMGRDDIYRPGGSGGGSRRNNMATAKPARPSDPVAIEALTGWKKLLQLGLLWPPARVVELPEPPERLDDLLGYSIDPTQVYAWALRRACNLAEAAGVDVADLEGMAPDEIHHIAVETLRHAGVDDKQTERLLPSSKSKKEEYTEEEKQVFAEEDGAKQQAFFASQTGTAEGAAEAAQILDIVKQAPRSMAANESKSEQNTAPAPKPPAPSH